MTATTIDLPSAAPSATTEDLPRDSDNRDRRAGWLFATPFVVLYALFLIGPVLIGLVVSFFNTASVSKGLGAWVGLQNYQDVLSDQDFWSAMWHSTLFTLLSTPVLVLLPLLFAIFASRIARGQWLYRLAFFAPYVVPSSIAVIIFGFMYTPETGLITKAFTSVGLSAPNFLGSTSGAWFAVVLLTTWWTLGFNFVLYLAALQDIPEDLYEAAALDGATAWQTMRGITIPLLRPTMSLVLILQVLASLKVFDQIYLLLAGGPGGSTRPAIEYIFDTGFTNYRGGFGAAATMVYFLVLVAVAAAWAVVRRPRTGVTA